MEGSRKGTSGGTPSEPPDQTVPTLADIATAQEVFAARQRLGEEVIGHAHTLKVEALVGLGELLKQTPKQAGGRYKPEVPMSLLDTLSAFFSRPAEEITDDTPEGAFPNCWGRYEYGGEIRKIVRDRQIDVNNGLERHAFIQDFVVTHVDGILLRNDDRGYVCPKCGAHYP